MAHRDGTPAATRRTESRSLPLARHHEIRPDVRPDLRDIRPDVRDIRPDVRPDVRPGGRHGRPRPLGGQFRLPAIRVSGAAMAMSTVVGISIATTWLISAQQRIGYGVRMTTVGATPAEPATTPPGAATGTASGGNAPAAAGPTAPAPVAGATISAGPVRTGPGSTGTGVGPAAARPATGRDRK
ncbi:hypothetical protein ACQRUO_38890, partial [Kitasatospora sp. LaBMicrA B282]